MCVKVVSVSHTRLLRLGNNSEIALDQESHFADGEAPCIFLPWLFIWAQVTLVTGC